MNFIIVIPCLAFCAGILNGLGGSGGVVFMSSLMMLGIAPVSATSINKACAIFGSIGAVYNFCKDKSLIKELSRILISFSVIGALIGAYLALHINEMILGRVFPFLILFFLIMEISKSWLKQISLIVATENRSTFINFIGFVSGFYNGIFGPGTLMITTLPLHIFIGMSLIDGLAIATCLNAITNFTACITYSSGSMNIFIVPISILGLSMLANFCGQFIGSKISINSGDKILRSITIITMSLLLIYLLVKYWF